MLTVAQSCNQVFELVIGMYDRFVWVLVISFKGYKLQNTCANYITLN